MKLRMLLLSALVFVALAVNGCANRAKRVVIDYQTAAQRNARDTEHARRLNAEAIDLIRDGKLDRAEQHVKQALALDVAFGPAHNTLGRVYYAQGRYYLAAWEFDYAAKLMPNHPEPRNNLGLVLEAVGRYDDAMGEYDRALAIEPDNVQVIGNLARARDRSGHRDDRLRDLLAELVMKDTRPDWRDWARRRLMLMGGPRKDEPRKDEPRIDEPWLEDTAPQEP